MKNQPEETKGLEYGFEVGGCDPMPTTHCAYKSETNEFDIDNVTITFYYGGDFDEDLNSYLKHTNIPEFDVYFAEYRYDENGKQHYEPLYLIDHRKENFVSEKYRCRLNNPYDNPTFLIFNYSEEITIPKELFTKNRGTLWFSVEGVNKCNGKQKLLAHRGLNYDIVDGKVIISPWNGTRS
ncbi:MAG: hypothetical protein K2H02_03970 [Anaeroplasmataceae bacterium]|nr:hypothetical protein [Anaeroplasmataceae bacterium]